MISLSLIDHDLRLEALTLWLRESGQPVVSDVDLFVPAGQTVALVGGSGAGKTSLALSVMGLWPGRSSGRILLGAQNLSALTAAAWRDIRGRDLVFMAQDPKAAINPALTIGWQLREILRLRRGCSRQATRAEALEWLERVGLKPAAKLARLYVHQLSGGMAQRVALAMSLACRPLVLIADEPFSALDPTTMAAQIELVKEWQNRLQFSLLLITHDLSVAGLLAEAVTVIEAGRVVEDGPIETVFSRPAHEYTRALLAAGGLPLVLDGGQG